MTLNVQMLSLGKELFRMLNGKRVLAIISARGGSKGVPGKNIRLLAGKPLIAWTIEEALRSNYVDNVIVSSDDDTIIRIAEEWGANAPFKRPAHLAEDDTPGMLPIIHALKEMPGYDYIVDLQPTSPLRLAQDIDACLEMLSVHTPSVVSVTEPDHSPYWMFTLEADNKMKSILGTTGGIRRQELPTVYSLNGAVYVADVEWLLNKETFLSEETAAFVMPKERSIDIDTLMDFHICEYLMARKQ